MPTPTTADPASHPSVARFRSLLLELDHPDTVIALPTSARTAAEAAAALGTTPGSIASSLVFGITTATGVLAPVLVVTSGAHRVNTTKVAHRLEVDRLQRVDATFVRAASGYAIGGVAPIGWRSTEVADGGAQPYQPTTLIDSSLAQYPRLWAAAGHPHCVFETTYEHLVRLTGGDVADVD
jgi:prolyl-tRNA editing enzyme YbaK/EbsC (Cys-tRNA(Pro) deacylase)